MACIDKSDNDRIVSTKNGFYFLFIFLYQRDRRGGIDSKMLREEELQWNPCPLFGLVSRHTALRNLATESGLSFRKFLWTFANFGHCRCYIYNLDKSNPSLSEC